MILHLLQSQITNNKFINLKLIDSIQAFLDLYYIIIKFNTIKNKWK